MKIKKLFFCQYLEFKIGEKNRERETERKR
jgi:hypothetical protein